MGEFIFIVDKATPVTIKHSDDTSKATLVFRFRDISFFYNRTYG